MSLWNKVQQLSQGSIQKIHSLYGDHFPIEVRHVLSSWIEDKVGNSELYADNPLHKQYIENFVEGLIKELEIKINEMTTDDPYFLRIKLLNAIESLMQRYSHDPVSLFRFLRHCLSVELAYVNHEERLSNTSTTRMNIPTGNGGPGNTLMMASNPIMTNQELQHQKMLEINERLVGIKHRTMETAEILKRMEQEQEVFTIKCHGRQKFEGGIMNLHRIQSQSSSLQNQPLEKILQNKKERLDGELKLKITDLIRLKNELEEKITLTITELNVLQCKVLDEELTFWKREQQLAGNGAPPPLINNLDLLQNWCEELAELIWQNRYQLKEIERLRQIVPMLNQQSQQGQQQQPLSNTTFGDRLNLLQEKVTQLLSSLVTSTFIVESQPPQVMKTNTRFAATVRLLVGGRLNVHMTLPKVKVTIISEAQANSLLRNDKSETNVRSSDSSGEILNNIGKMEYHHGTRHLYVHFQNMQLKRIKRTEKKGTESVMDEKFCLHFQCEFTIGETELIFKIWTLSLPIVVIVHGSQEPHGWATITWDNAFCEPGKIPFQVPDRVSWFRVAQVLNVKFKSITGRGLTDDNLKYLSEKAFRLTSSPPSANNGTNDLLTWNQFCKEPLPDKNFTFWEWFYAIMKLTRDHLHGPWVDSSILGFIGRIQAEKQLINCVSGTFLLRFSDSELGGITIAWVHNDQKVLSVVPFTGKDLTIRSLSDRINDIEHLHYLYPDIPKTKIFSKYYTPVPAPSSGKGYVKHTLSIQIPGLYESEPQQQLYSSPQLNTPQSSYHTPSPGDVSISSILSQQDDHCPSGGFPDIDNSLMEYAGLILDDFNLDFTN